MDEQTIKVGQLERETQNRIVKVFKDLLNYDYLGNWEDREDNRNIEEELLRKYLVSTEKYSEKVIDKSIRELQKTATNQTQELFDINRDVKKSSERIVLMSSSLTGKILKRITSQLQKKSQ